HPHCGEAYHAPYRGVTMRYASVTSDTVSPTIAWAREASQQPGSPMNRVLSFRAARIAFGASLIAAMLSACGQSSSEWEALNAECKDAIRRGDAARGESSCMQSVQAAQRCGETEWRLANSLARP